MPFLGLPVVTQISDRIVRITGVTLPAGGAGAIALHGNTLPVLAGPQTIVPDLGAAAPFGFLANTIFNPQPGTVVNGDLGYLELDGETPTVTGSTHIGDSVYDAAIDAGRVALAELLAEPATFTFASGPVNLSTDTTHGPAGVFAPGVYEIDGDTSIDGGTTLSLSGAGHYVFRINGTLVSGVATVVQCIDGALPGDVWWVPNNNINLDDNTVFVGNATPSDPQDTIMADSVVWVGRVLGDAGVIAPENATTITVPSSPPPPTLMIDLPATFQPSTYRYGGQSVTLQDSVEAVVIPAGASATMIPFSVVKTGSTVEDFDITITNTSSVDSPTLEIEVRFHD